MIRSGSPSRNSKLNLALASLRPRPKSMLKSKKPILILKSPINLRGANERD